MGSILAKDRLETFLLKWFLLKAMEYLNDKEGKVRKQLNSHKARGKKVIAKHGEILGTLACISIHEAARDVDGIIVKRGLFRESLFIANNYIERISEEAILLNVDPVYLLQGKKVMTDEGEYIGKVSEVKQNGNANEIKSIVVQRRFKKYTISNEAIKHIKKTVIVKLR